MHISSYTTTQKTRGAIGGAARACAALFAACALPALGADKYSTYGALSFFGVNQSFSSCSAVPGMASVRLAIPDSYDYLPNNFAMVEGTNSVTFSFRVSETEGGNFATRPALRLHSLEAWRTYQTLGAGTFEFVSLQKLSNGERLSDAIRLSRRVVASGCLSPRADFAEVLLGDMQVSAVGTPFSTPSISVKISTRFPEQPSVGASVALASEVIVDEAFDTGIDGPKVATQADAVGTATFRVTPGTKVGIKRFIVKARSDTQTNAASAMVTLAHAPIGAPVVNSVPIVEYTYDDGGLGARVRYLTGAAAVTRQLDSLDERGIFSRTGQVWRAFTDIAAAPGLAPVCQFFGRLTSAATVSHFYTANAQECATLRARWGDAGSAGPGLKYEGVAFYAAVPDAQQRCPRTFPIQIKRYFVSLPSPYHEYLVVDQKTQEPPFAPRGALNGIAFCTDVATAF